MAMLESAQMTNEGAQTTTEIVQSTAILPLYKRSTVDLREAWVSSRSRWFDAVWVLDGHVPGQSPSARSIRWQVRLCDGSLLTEPRYADILDFLRRIVWSLFANRARGAPHSSATANSVSRGMQVVARWLVDTRRTSVADITSAGSWEFLEDLPLLLGHEADVRLTYNQVMPGVLFIQKLWYQAPLVGIARAEEAPFDGLSSVKVIEKVANGNFGTIPPLPDDVAILILNAASKFVEEYAEDILSLFDLVRHRRVGRGQSRYVHWYFQAKAATSFRFKILKGECGPWHPRIKGNNALDTVTNLVRSLRAACVIIVQSTTGMRISEICGIAPGIDWNAGLPSCIEKRTTDDGVFDLFLLGSKLAKTEVYPRAVQWVVGMSPVGSSYQPLAVCALVLLNRLLEIGEISTPGMKSILSGRITIAKSEKGLRHSGLLALAIQNGMKSFVEEWVDLSGLPDESRYPLKPNDLAEWRKSKGRIIRTHQFRKTFAQFAAAIDARLVEAVQHQFKHISLAMTYKAYVNSEQHVALTSMDATRVARMMYDTMFADAPLAGVMGQKIERAIPATLKAEIKRLPPSEAWKKTVAWMEEDEFRLIVAPHGKCGGSRDPLKMRCREVSGTVDWLAHEPDYETQEPSLCAGCSCFVLDAQHLGFWRERYKYSRIAVLGAERSGIGGDYRAIRWRADQARSFLRYLGDDLGALDQMIESEIGKGGVYAGSSNCPGR